MTGRTRWLQIAARTVLCTAALVFAAGPPAKTQNSTQPNIIVILADDLGYGDLSSYGNPDIRTPRLDRMASEGQRWTSFYSGGPVCSPSRAALLTGRLPVRVGVYRLRPPDDALPDSPGVFMANAAAGLPGEEITIAEMLKARGYGTAIIGKWHLGHLPEYLPQRHGFDLHFGLPYSNDMQLAPGIKGGRDLVMNPRVEYWAGTLLRNGDVIEQPVQQQTLTKR